MIRTVSARLEVTVTEPARLAVQVAVAAEHADHLEETVSVTLDGNPVELLDVAAPVGGRIWVVDAARGALEIGYDATLTGVSTPPPDDIAAHLLYLRPSRYAESDRMVGFASRLFRDIGAPTDVLAAVSSWVGTQLEYVSGSSGPTDGAVDTLLAGRGVCRDFGHLAVVLLRAKQIPPGWSPCTHRVSTQWTSTVLLRHSSTAWHVVDGTLLAPRESLVRIATGRDAADTSFLSTYGGAIALGDMTVTATVDGQLPVDDVQDLITLH